MMRNIVLYTNFSKFLLACYAHSTFLKHQIFWEGYQGCMPASGEALGIKGRYHLPVHHL